MGNHWRSQNPSPALSVARSMHCHRPLNKCSSHGLVHRWDPGNTWKTSVSLRLKMLGTQGCCARNMYALLKGLGCRLLHTPWGLRVAGETPQTAGLDGVAGLDLHHAGKVQGSKYPTPKSPGRCYSAEAADGMVSVCGAHCHG